MYNPFLELESYSLHAHVHHHNESSLTECDFITLYICTSKLCVAYEISSLIHVASIERDTRWIIFLCLYFYVLDQRKKKTAIKRLLRFLIVSFSRIKSTLRGLRNWWWPRLQSKSKWLFQVLSVLSYYQQRWHTNNESSGYTMCVWNFLVTKRSDMCTLGSNDVSNSRK